MAMVCQEYCRPYTAPGTAWLSHDFGGPVPVLDANGRHLTYNDGDLQRRRVCSVFSQVKGPDIASNEAG